MRTGAKAVRTNQLLEVHGIGPHNLQLLASIGIDSAEALFYYFPRAYDDFTHISNTNQARPGQISVRGTLHVSKSRYSRRGLHITEGYVEDDSGRLPIVWFNQPYRARAIKKDIQYFVSGKYEMNSMRLCFVNPVIEFAHDVEKNGHILGRYKETAGLSSHQIRTFVRRLIDSGYRVKERLPDWIVRQFDLYPLQDAIREMHIPSSMQTLERARYRFSFEELFHLQIASLITKRALQKEKASVIPFHPSIAKEFISSLPFQPTDDQRRVVWQIYKDMQQSEPMNRLIEGDVGSGKTVVAAMATAMVLHAKRQVLYMAPTELLAQQHAATFAQLLAHTPWASSIGLLTGSLSNNQKSTLHTRIAHNDCRIVIGTHALLQDAVATHNVGLVIIDEQHRFGVEQRQRIRQKGGLMPHVLCMTATPIPRTLALTLYGELDISVMHSSPAGRLPVITEVVPYQARASVYQRVDEELRSGRQAFIVCPLVSESPNLQVKAVETLYEELSSGLLKKQRLALLHGSLKSLDKEKIMQEFSEGALDALVATTVIEVGVNVPNATIMVIEGAERFGLAQLHQLRGRVGRGNEQGYCFLIPSQDTGVSRRMRAISTTHDGFKLAELDLELRGPGAIYGSRQSGVLDLSFANLADRDAIEQAKIAATSFLDKKEKLIQYPYLSERVRYFQTVSRLN